MWNEKDSHTTGVEEMEDRARLIEIGEGGRGPRTRRPTDSAQPVVVSENNISTL